MIISACFLAFAIIALIVSIFYPKYSKQEFKKYYVGSAAVYLSGNILIFIVVLVNKEILPIFSLISCLSVFVIFLFTVFMIWKMISSFEKIKESDKGNCEIEEEIKNAE